MNTLNTAYLLDFFILVTDYLLLEDTLLINVAFNLNIRFNRSFISSKLQYLYNYNLQEMTNIMTTQTQLFE